MTIDIFQENDHAPSGRSIMALSHVLFLGRDDPCVHFGVWTIPGTPLPATGIRRDIFPLFSRPESQL